MSKKDETDAEFLARLGASLAKDDLRADVPIEEVVSVLRAAGGDPGAIAERGRELAKKLLDARRLSWMEDARAEQLRMQRLLGARKPLVRRPRHEEVAILEAARTTPGLEGAVEMLFRKRQLAEVSDEAIHELLEEVEALRALTDTGGDGEKGA